MALIQSPPSNQIQIDLAPKAFELLADTKMKELVQSINNRYLYWDKVKHICPPTIQAEGLRFESVNAHKYIND